MNHGLTIVCMVTKMNINLKVVDAGNIGLDKLLGEEEAAAE